MTVRSAVVHGHFYQPPREDPWTREVPVEPSASPFHDWNERIHAECYRTVAVGRVLDAKGDIAAIVPALDWMSWDAAPTLLRWLAREEPHTYAAFVEGDARSLARLGHGNAVAAPYHHVILPLASRRDKVTEVRWGIADFRRRFGREPEGMWLPETAVDMETLDVLAREGVRFTVLGPNQVRDAPNDGLPGTVSLPAGRSIAVFVYDGGLSHDLAFGRLLEDAHEWVDVMAKLAREPERRLVSLATDGETFGHHHRWGDMALAAALRLLAARADIRLENFASVLARRRASRELTIVDETSWSCVHGIERWRSDCGCKIAPHRPSSQAWRGVLRDALEDLGAELAEVFGREAGKLLPDPWAARDAWGDVLEAGPSARRRFVELQAGHPLRGGEASRAEELLELQHDALSMFTSCGWFFDDLARIEPLQVLRYAAHAIDLAGEAAPGLERRLREALRRAQTGDPDVGDGRRLWDERVRGPSASEIPPKLTGDRWAAGDDPSPADAISTPSSPDPAHGLATAVRLFTREPDEHRARTIAEALVSLENEERGVPVEVQHSFVRAVADRADAPTPDLQDVARRLGFADDFLRDGPMRAAPPVGFVVALHLHQPVGNFDEVYQAHTDDVYEPLLRALARDGFGPLGLHVSGPLLEWLESNRHPLLDLVGDLASDGFVELLLSGFYEPVLPALSRVDRRGQIAWMREWLRSRFGVEATGLWLTERVWEPGLAEDLHDAGVRYVLVDDRAFLVSGFEEAALHRPYRSEAGGKSVTLLPIDERLRYLIPFRPPSEIAAYLSSLRRFATGRSTTRSAPGYGRPLAVLADDGEKFGGWPGTARWVWEAGWMDRFLDTMRQLREDGAVVMLTPGDAATSDEAGVAYLPTASYREMEGWSLPPTAAGRFRRLTEILPEIAVTAGSEAHVRGGHWRNFLARYAESGRMHNKALRLSELCRERGDPAGARRALGRAQCNDAYWHGVFGGLYLKHLREAVWAHLAEAEGLLRTGEGLEVERSDADGDGHDEVMVHSSRFSATVAPARGGSLEELTYFAARSNLADVLTRRRESYHRPAHDRSAGAVEAPGDGEGEISVAAGTDKEGGMPSIHDLEGGLALDQLPPVDLDVRAILVDRVLPPDLSLAAYGGAEYEAVRSWAGERFEVDTEVEPNAVRIRMRGGGAGALRKTLRFSPNGELTVGYEWDPAAFPPDAVFAPELSLARDVLLKLSPDPLDVWRYEIRTVSKSERGFEESFQGVSLTPRWPCALGEAVLRLGPPAIPPATRGNM